MSKTLSRAHPKDGPWKILVVDDEVDVFAVTELTLDGLRFDGRAVELHHAASAAAARTLLAQDQFAVALVDVVMESDDAGLQLVRHIRGDLRELQTRLIIRTGQPGVAPEWAVVVDHDINGYEDKTTATAQRLRTAVLTALRGFDQLQRLERARAAVQQHNTHLRQLVDSLRELAARRGDESRQQRVLQDLCRMIGSQSATGAVLVERRPVDSDQDLDWVIAAVGSLSGSDVQELDALPEAARACIQRSLADRSSDMGETHSCIFTESARHRPRVYYVQHGSAREAGEDMLQLFCQHITDASDAVELTDEVKAAQAEMVLVLSEAVEARSQETGNHVRRVGAYSRALADAMGLPPAEGEILERSAPLHDIGKVSIPDAVLQKPGALNDEEWALMKTHAQIGRDLLRDHPQPIMRAAAIVAGQHHEKWDGSGYPAGLAGEDIHIYGRITAVADVFDAISSERVYKEAWPIDQCLAHVRGLRGTHFDPAVVDAFEACFDQLLEIRERYAD